MKQTYWKSVSGTGKEYPGEKSAKGRSSPKQIAQCSTKADKVRGRKRRTLTEQQHSGADLFPGLVPTGVMAKEQTGILNRFF